MVLPGHDGKALLATILALTGVLTACRDQQALPELPLSSCQGDTTPIAGVQGDAYQSPLQSQQVTVRGLVTQLRNTGLFIEEPGSDDSELTSDGLFIQSSILPGHAVPGDLLVVQGIVTELGEDRDTLTAMMEIRGFRLCARGQALPMTRTALPLSAQRKEALEGMHLSLRQLLLVTDVYSLRRGHIRISADRILPVPTEVARPGADARRQARINRESSLEVALLANDRQTYSVGTTVSALSGVLGHDGRGLRLLLREAPPTVPGHLYRIEPAADQDVRILGLNLHNYFNGDGMGGDFPTPRGAKSQDEFAEQRRRLTAAIEKISPHLVAVMELENDGFEETSAATDFKRDLEAATREAWQMVNPGTGVVGSDTITVGIFYREDVLLPVGRPNLLNAPPFAGLSRTPVAQTFQHRASGETFLVVVNHFKSKGSCPDSGANANQRDGQGCWNPARVAAAKAMTQWVSQLADLSANSRALILGDLNAHRLEDPVRAIIDAGFEDLTATGGVRHEYSYVYRGESGTLDYAFASGALRPSVRRASILNINAGWPPGVPLKHDWLRSSDHDPVVIDLRFRQAATSD